MYFPKHDVFKIENYINDGFVKVCSVSPQSTNYQWFYENINNDVMFDDHTSWIYFIVVDGIIFKCGETGNPLGVESTQLFEGERQPRGSSICRFGRLARGDMTDAFLRESINPYIKKGVKVELWARKCPIYHVEQTVCGKPAKVLTTIHKNLEQDYLANFKYEASMLPPFNKAHK